MLTFDEHGHLTPDQPIESTLEELEATFVFNDRRRLIFIKILEFLDEVNLLIPSDFLIWMDGSFVTKKEKPGDLDCVFFVDYGWLGKQERIIETLPKKYVEWIDSYFVSVYPENHRFRIRTDSDRIKWLHFFTTNRQKLPKGLVQINF